ncbi:hypothetical protein [Kordiimonas sp.]|uniref:hypothetical protein n=1 Tax=Kordiimonas sp. TaxID=1970157 RepID=UPI003A940D35
MADATFAMRSQSAAPITRSERASARPSGASEVRSGEFSRGLSSGTSSLTSASATAAVLQDNSPRPGSGLLSTGVQFALAETRTQEASAPLPPISSLGRARDSYLNVQASVRETIALNRQFAALTAQPDAGEQTEAAPASASGRLDYGSSGSTTAANPYARHGDDEFDSDSY